MTTPLRQTPDEAAAFKAALTFFEHPKLAPEDQAQSDLHKNRQLFEACEEGHDGAVIAWLREGASPHCAEAHPLSYALDAALIHCTPRALEALLDAKATIKHSPAPDTPAFYSWLFDAASVCAPLDNLKYLHDRFKNDPLNPNGAPRILAGLLKAQRILPLFQWCEHTGLRPSDEELNACFYGHLLPALKAKGRFVKGGPQAELEHINTYIIDQVYPHFCEDVQRRIFGETVFHDHFQLLKQLLSAGYKPHKEWLADSDSHHETACRFFQHVPLLALAYLGGAHRQKHSHCSVFLNHYTPALEHGKGHSVPPYAFYELPVKALMDFKDLGFCIDGTDEQGRNVAHYWAIHDPSVREGWKTLMKQEPQLVQSRCTGGMHSGKSAFDILLSKLPAGKRDSYEKAFALLEQKALQAILQSGPADGTGAKSTLKKRALRV